LTPEANVDNAQLTTEAPSNPTTILETAAQLGVTASTMGEEIDAMRGLPEPLLSGLRKSGLLRAGAPKEVGALELPPGVALRCAEEIAKGNMSAGWCVSIAITSSLLVGFLPPSARERLFGDGRGVAAGVWAPRGSARNGPDGVTVSGRWSFCSGITHADYLFGGCVLEDGSPAVAAMPVADLQILDTWHTLGLRGTGSHDTVAESICVPTDQVFALTAGPVIDRALYRFPTFGFFALCITAAAMGNARAAIDGFVELATEKKGSGSSRTLAERPAVQAAVAEAQARLAAARALYYESIEAAWLESQGGDPVSVAARTQLRLAATHGVRTAADVVHTMYDLAGGTAIYDGAALQRQLRDALTATAHFQVNAASRELPGRLLLDLPTQVAGL
jgi:indole-3-acetate monooxygenase